MNTLFLAAMVIAVVGFFLFFVLTRGKDRSHGFPYQLSKYLLSKAERSFYGVLVQAVGNSGIVFAKARVADVISPKRGIGRSDWQRAFNAISSKHLDFIVCDPNDCSIKLAVELDDSSHDSSKAKRRDNFLNDACRSAGLPLLRIKAAKSYVVSDLQRQVAEAVSPRPQYLEQPTPPVVAKRAAPAELPDETAISPVIAEHESSLDEKPVPSSTPDTRPEPPVCPKCGKPMLLRKAKSGANAGQEFWGCSAFPKCRAVMQAGA